jgi:hypothetical protein
LDSYRDYASDVIFCIVAPKSRQLTAECDTKSYVYDANYKLPTLTVKCGDKILVKGIDYRIVYADNLAAGTATATAKGIGNYEGEQASDTFTILPAPVTFEVNADPDKLVYTGSQQTPKITVKNADSPSSGGTVTLQEGVDYTVQIRNNTEVGQASVTVTGIGNYAGSTGTGSFEITELTLVTGSNISKVANCNIWFGGLLNMNYFTADCDIENGSLTMTTENRRPHFLYNGSVYSYIAVYDANGSRYYYKEHIGNAYQGETKTIDIGIGCIIELYHAEASNTNRYKVRSAMDSDILLSGGEELERYEVTATGLKKIYPVRLSEEEVLKNYYAALEAYMDALIAEHGSELKQVEGCPDEKQEVEQALNLCTEEQRKEFAEKYREYYPFPEEYRVEHYSENLDGSYELKETESLSGAAGEQAAASPKSYEGFTCDQNVEGTSASGIIAGDGSLTLRLYYTRNSYKVTYRYNGKVPAGASSLPAEKTYRYGETVQIEDMAEAPGYVFSGWSRTKNFEMPAEDVSISGSFAVAGDTPYQQAQVLYTGKYIPGSVDEDGNVTYGMLVPTSVTFTNSEREREANVSIVALGKRADGTNASLDDFSELKVQISVASENGYQLKYGTSSVDYRLKMEGQANDAVFDSDMEDNTAAKEITQRLGISSGCVSEAKGKATLLSISSEDGPFSDTLVYAFKEEAKVLK